MKHQCYECGRLFTSAVPIVDPHDPDRLWCSVDCRDRSAEKQAEFAARVANQ